MRQSQLLKGVLEGCVLAIVAQGEIYGYELMQALRGHGFISVAGGTIYPLLAKMERNGDVGSLMRPSPDGPDRRYYRISAQGRRSLSDFQHQWRQLATHVDEVLSEKGNRHEKVRCPRA